MPVDYALRRDLARTYENQVLYQMCVDAPYHTDPVVNAGKIILIGRTYAASPQRGAGAALDVSHDFFDAMGEALKASRIDTLLEEIKPLARIDDDSVLGKVVETHKHLVTTLVTATKRWAKKESHPRQQPSFASKYLHFHRPNAFPVMDGRAKDGLRRNDCGGTLDSYEEFCRAVLRYARKQSETTWTLRGLDGSLLGASR